MRIEETAKADFGGVEDIGAKCVGSIRAAMAAGDVNASGATSASLGYRQSQWELTVYAEGKHAPIFSLQNSVKPTPRGGDGFLPEIVQWVRDRGLTVRRGPRQTEEAAQWAAARAIYHNIWENGTRRTFPPSKEIYSPALAEAVEDFTRQVGDSVVKILLKK